MTKFFKYVIIINGKVFVRKTAKLKKVILDNFSRFDSRDCIFEENESIRVFVENESLFTRNKSVTCHCNNQVFDTFYGIVIFAKLGPYGFNGLSNNDIKVILSHLFISNDGLFNLIV